MEHFIKLYKKKKGKDLRKDNRAVQKLRREVEKAKRSLSAAHQVKRQKKYGIVKELNRVFHGC